jgi:hypothetical protein
VFANTLEELRDALTPVVRGARPAGACAESGLRSLRPERQCLLVFAEVLLVNYALLLERID